MYEEYCISIEDPFIHSKQQKHWLYSVGSVYYLVLFSVIYMFVWDTELTENGKIPQVLVHNSSCVTCQLNVNVGL